MNFLNAFVIILIILMVVMFIQNQYNEVEYVKSSIDDRSYLVRRLPDSQAAANYLASVNQKLTKLVHHMMAKYPEDEEVQQLYNNYSPDSISEGSVDSGYTSYAVNKGQKLILCIRQRNMSFVDEQIVLYVAIHEVAHIMTKEIGHTSRFWDNFKFLLDEAIMLGIYKYMDYNKNPKDYCGIKISNTIL